ncbi:MAG: flagellar basal body rod protein FlgC [Thermodesulfobacteriota bacterium]|nr:flagellar basal body rod protein FlgC [Thermodesulfobacteriota bacterium]
MDFETAMRISSSGMRAHRAWMNVLSANLANVNTTRGPDGKPYQRRTILYESVPYAGSFEEAMESALEDGLQQVEVAGIVPDGRDFRRVYDPSHPDADEDGIVLLPNISAVEEMANLLDASRSYEANLAALNMAKQLALKSLELGK